VGIALARSADLGGELGPKTTHLTSIGRLWIQCSTMQRCGQGDYLCDKCTGRVETSSSRSEAFKIPSAPRVSYCILSLRGSRKGNETQLSPGMPMV